MKRSIYPTISMLLFVLLISFASSCQKDTDLLLDTVLYEDEIAEVVLLARGGNGPDPNTNKNADDDGDGVSNDLDDCPFTPLGAKVNEQGCAASQYDTDKDGIVDNQDQCPGTPAGSSVDASGCASSQKTNETPSDNDQDGVANEDDLCPNTPAGASVNKHGCTNAQWATIADDDEDGVTNDKDECPDTPSGESVNGQGCSDSQLDPISDDDNDGVPNEQDDCPYTPAGATVNNFGCAASQYDTDGDGVNDSLDECPNTTSGQTVDSRGCPESTGWEYPEPDYYVTTTGNPNNDGLTEQTAWSLDYAFRTAKAGDVVYIKAGNYGNIELIVNNSGTLGNPIRFIGYRNTPGDIVSTSGSTFQYGDKVDSAKMPLISGATYLDGLGMHIRGNYIEISNFQITNYLVGLLSTGNHVSMTNLIISNNGEQRNNSVQGGRGFQIHGDFNIVNNCFSLNSNGEGINLKGSKNSQIINTSVFSDNLANPNGYYIAITGGGSNNLIDNCTVYRDQNADLHRGHGFVLKDSAFNNIIRNSKAYNTGIEVNFSGVYNNLFEDIDIYGSYSSDNSEFSSNIRIINGARDNIFKDIAIQDCRYAINFHDFDDGYRAQDADRDQDEGGSNNQFINIQVNKAKNIIGATSPEVGPSAFSDGNTFTRCSFSDITGTPFFSYQTITNTKMIECSFTAIPSTVLIREYDGGSLQIDFDGCSFSDVRFPLP